jgi:hypothetical protein
MKKIATIGSNKNVFPISVFDLDIYEGKSCFKNLGFLKI